MQHLLWPRSGLELSLARLRSLSALLLRLDDDSCLADLLGAFFCQAESCQASERCGHGR